MKEIFVFGSNLAGRHGKGAALFAKQNHGAIYGQGVGIQGNSYAIPTKDRFIKTLPLSEIRKHVNNFVQFAIAHPELTFNVTRIGCGLAKLNSNDVASLFINAPDNCYFDELWKPCLGNTKNYWGTFK